jgi:hypothetical protein
MPTNRAELPIELLEGFSRGSLTRREIQERIGRPLRFGELLAELHARKLPLPRVPADPASPGFRLVKQLVERALARAG